MGLREEIGKKTPFDSLEEEAFLNILRTHQHVIQSHARFCKSHGITETQYNVLRILNGAEKGTLPSLEVARRMVTNLPDITRLIDRLQKSGYVERKPCPTDRRVIHIHITAAGRRLVKKLWQPMLDLHKAQLGHLSQKELKELNRLLEKARQHGAT